jgi:hypothetical protein
MTIQNDFKMIEPLMSNRWVIETSPTNINTYLFKKYRMFNENDVIVFKTEFYETIEGTYNPKDLLNITDIQLKYLSPVGDVVAGYHIKVKGINFEKKHSYKNDDLLTTKLRIIVGDVNNLFVENGK